MHCIICKKLTEKPQKQIKSKGLEIKLTMLKLIKRKLNGKNLKPEPSGCVVALHLYVNK